MQKIFRAIDKLGGINQENKLGGWLERIAFIFLFIMVVSAPHSIAATQTAWLCGMLAWVLRFFVKPRPHLIRTPLSFALLIFFIWSVITCFFSYEPLISISKLRSAALFLIFCFVINNLRTLRALKVLVFALIFSCLVNVLWMPIQRISGRGVEIHGVSAESPLGKARLIECDTLLKANGKKIATPEDLVAEIEGSAMTKVEFYRPDFYYTVEVKRADLLDGDALGKLGIESWKVSRNWRSQGFYNHYETYAEVLQLIISLIFGLFIASIGEKRRRGREKISEVSNLKLKVFATDNRRSKLRDQSLNVKSQEKKSPFRLFYFSPLLFLCLIATALALLLTITRASQIAFLVSAFAIVVLNGNRKILLTLAALILPVALIGSYVLEQSREIGFFDQHDESTTYRETVYREGINLWLQNPRHFFFGIGMDTITKKERVGEWHLFDNGKLPMSHFHSTPIQLLVERGLLGLMFWLLILGIYLRTLFRGLKTIKDDENLFFAERETSPSKFLPFSAYQLRRGVILGCLGGTLGFLTSSLVHYNYGDGEVVMMFYLLMAFGIFACKLRTAEFQ